MFDCALSDGVVSYLDLSNNQLSGTITSAISVLTGLRYVMRRQQLGSIAGVGLKILSKV